MPDDRVPAGIPSVPSPDDLMEASEPSSGGGFLVDDTDEQPLDGEQLFRAAIAPEPPPPPLSSAPAPSLAAGSSTAEAPAPIDNAVLLRVGGLVAIGLGIFAFLGSRELPFPLLLVIGGAIAFYLSSPTRLMRDQVVDSWDCLIDGGQGRGTEIVASTSERITSQSLPSVSHTQAQFTASMMRGGNRPFLVISQRANGRLRPYKMYVSVRDYGTNLQTSWFLIYHRGFFEKLKPNPMVELNLFDEQDLRAYVTAVHHAFLDGVIDLMLSLGKDTSTLDRKTKGFLGIS